MPYTLTHISKGRGKTTLSFATLDEARITAHRWRRSPKTRKVILGYTPDQPLSEVINQPTPKPFSIIYWIDDKLWYAPKRWVNKLKDNLGL